jgi:hypothetical protein
MTDMISQIKNIIALFIAKRKFARKQNVAQNFQKCFSNAHDIMMILPSVGNSYSSEVVDIIKFVDSQKKRILFINKIEFKNYLPTGYGHSAIEFSELDKTKLGLPTKEIINKINKLSFDLVIDLNLEDDIFATTVSNIPQSNFRIGFVKNKSDVFYNYQLTREINSEKSYRNLLNSLRMF